MTETHMDLRIAVEEDRLKGLRIVDFNDHFWFGRLFHTFDEDGEPDRYGMEHAELLNND